MNRWRLAWAIARPSLSARFAGLRLLVVCLTIGVAALAAVSTLTATISQGLATRGRQILGGDVEVSVWQRGLTDAERAALGQYGTVSEGTRLQAMASANDASVPVELKAVDARWPLVGRLTLTDGRHVGAPPPGFAWFSDGALARLGIRPGASVNISGRRVTIGGVIADEPDRLGEGFALGPTVIVPAAFPVNAGLTVPGAMYRSKTRLACPRACDASAIAAAMTRQFPAAGFEVRTRGHAAPGADNFVSRMGDFLVLVGLAALLVAGIGIGGATAGFLEARRGSIATLKVLGATSADIARAFALEIALAALLGTALGVAAGPLAAAALGHAMAKGAMASLLPAGGMVLAPLALLRAAGFGLAVALTFAALPLAEAQALPAMALLRARVEGGSASPLRAAWPAMALGGAALLLLAFAGGGTVTTTAIFLAGAGAAFVQLAAVGVGLRRLAARLPRPHTPLVALALSNLHRPGAQTGRLVVALGFALTAFVAIATVETSLNANIAQRVPARAPDYFVLDLAPADLGRFTAEVTAALPGAHIRSVPALRGAILAYGAAGHMTRVADRASLPDKAWALKGERGLTYADAVPEGNVVTAGQWWPAGYKGEPLVSIDEKLADALDLHIGDELTIGLLGVERTARIASFRRIDWDSFGFNYVLVFSPNTLEDAPHKLAATINLPAGAAKGGLLARLTRGFPQVSVIEVGPILSEARALLAQMASAIRAAASLAVFAGIAVLLGAIAAARASRRYDAVVLRLLGARSRQLLGLVVFEYAGLALVVTGVALALGSLIGWLVVAKLFAFAFLPDWGTVAGVLAAGTGLTCLLALVASLPVLRARPAASLREL